MFEKLRKPFRTKNIAYYLIFGMVCLVFVFIGIPLGNQSNTAGSAFTVNNKLISWAEYQNHVEMMKQQSAGGDLDSRKLEQIKKQAIEALLNAELIHQETGRLRLSPPAEEVRDKILELPLFQKEGRFTHSVYRAFLAARGLTASYFENLIRREIQNALFQSMFHKAFHVSSAEKEKQRRLKSFRAQVSYIDFATGDLPAEELNRLSAVVRAGDSELLDHTIKDKQWKWEKTGDFDLSAKRLPGLTSHEKLFEEVFNHFPQTGLIKKISYLRDRAFILKVDSFTRQQEPARREEHQTVNSLLPLPAGANLDEDFSFPANKISARLAFLSWMRFTRSSAKLKFHPRLQN